jgi:hypothetical protein
MTDDRSRQDRPVIRPTSDRRFDGTTTSGGGDVFVRRDRQGSVQIGVGTSELSADQLERLTGTFSSFAARVARDAPDDLIEAARAQAEALEVAVLGPTPDPVAAGAACGWFADHLPKTSTSAFYVLANPLVGKIMASAGAETLEEYHHQLSIARR